MKLTVFQFPNLQIRPLVSNFAVSAAQGAVIFLSVFCYTTQANDALVRFDNPTKADTQSISARILATEPSTNSSAIAANKPATSKPTITIGVDYRFPPWIIADGSGTQQALMKALFNNLGYKVEFLSTPRERGSFLTDSEKIDGFILDKDNAEAKNAFLIPTAIAELEVIAFTSSNNTPIKSSCDLVNYNIGFLKGCNECLRLIETCPQRNIQLNKKSDLNAIKVKSIAYPSKLENLFRMLVNGRIDVAITDRRGGYYTIRQLNLKNIQVNAKISRPSQNYLFLHSKHHSLLEPLRTEMINLKNNDAYKPFFQPHVEPI